MPDMTVAIDVNVSVEVWCSCGAGLCGQSSTVSGYGGDRGIQVEPCEKCLEQARDEGFQQAINEEDF